MRRLGTYTFPGRRRCESLVGWLLSLYMKFFWLDYPLFESVEICRDRPITHHGSEIAC
jgi:hypothetical protein